MDIKNCGVKSTVDISQTVVITANKHAERVRRDGGTISVSSLVTFLTDYYNRFGTLASITYSPQADVFGYKRVGDGKWKLYALFMQYDIVVNTTDLTIPNMEGKSAYDIAVENGFEGNVTEWLESLKGEKGDKGDSCTDGGSGEGGNVDLSNYLTKNEASSTYVGKESGKGLSTNDYTNADKNKLNGLSNYDDTQLKSDIAKKADKTELNNKADKSQLVGLATEVYVQNAIANAEIGGGGEVDLSNYLTKNEASSTYVEQINGKGLSTNDFTTIEKNKLSGLENYNDTQLKSDIAKKADITYVNSELDLKADKANLVGLASTTYVDNAIANVEVDTSNLATKTELNNKADKTQLVGLATETYVNEAIASVEGGTVDLTNYDTKAEVDKKIQDSMSNITIDTSDLATKEYMENLVGNLNNALSVIMTGQGIETVVDEFYKEQSKGYYDVMTSDILESKRMWEECGILPTDTNYSKLEPYKDSITYLPIINIGGRPFAEYLLENFKKIKTIPFLDTSKNIGFPYAFANCSQLSYVPLIDTSNVTNMSGMFMNCINLEKVPLFDTSNVTHMIQMFMGCLTLSSVPFFDTRNVVSMWGMFSYCESLTSVPFFNTSKVTNMDSMFTGCINLKGIPKFDTRNVTDMDSMFSRCENIDSTIELDTRNVTTMSSMFQTAPVQHIIFNDTSKVSNFSFFLPPTYTVKKLKSLKTLNLTSWDGRYFFDNSSSYQAPEVETLLFVPNSIFRDIYFHYSTMLSQESLDSIIEGLGEVSSTCNTKLHTKYSPTSSNTIKVTEAQLASATAKGWTVAFS